MKQLAKRLRTEGTLGTDDLIPAAQTVGEEVHLAGDELRKKSDVKILAKPEDQLSHGVESGGASATLFLEVRQGGGVVGEHRHNTSPKRRQETPKSQPHRQKLPVIDGKPR